MSMPGYGPWARLAYFRGSSEKGERVRGLIVQLELDRFELEDGCGDDIRENTPTEYFWSSWLCKRKFVPLCFRQRCLHTKVDSAFFLITQLDSNNVRPHQDTTPLRHPRVVAQAPSRFNTPTTNLHSVTQTAQVLQESK